MMGYDGCDFWCQLNTPKLPAGKTMLAIKNESLMAQLETQQLHFFPCSCGSCWCIGSFAQTLLGEPFPFAGPSFFPKHFVQQPFLKVVGGALLQSFVLFCRAFCTFLCYFALPLPLASLASGPTGRGFFFTTVAQVVSSSWTGSRFGASSRHGTFWCRFGFGCSL